MIVPKEVRPNTTHVIGVPCRCGHEHVEKDPVIRGPRIRAQRKSNIGYVLTGRLYQQVDILRAEGAAFFTVIRTVGTA
jgi:hypothetical protein